MRLRIFGVGLVVLSLLGCADKEEVYPSAAQKLKPLELGQAIYLFMPNQGMRHIDWSYLSDSKSIVWLDDSYKSGNVNTRTGILRVNVDGVKSTILKKEVKELAWSVVYVGAGNPNFGVLEIDLKPGVDDGDANCFGSTTQNCTFNPISSMAKAGINVDVLCRSTFTTGYLLSAKSKEPIRAKLVTSEGSGGASSWLEIYVSNPPQNLCE